MNISVKKLYYIIIESLKCFKSERLFQIHGMLKFGIGFKIFLIYITIIYEKVFLNF